MKSCPTCSMEYWDTASRCPLDGAPLVAAVDPRLGTRVGGYTLTSVVGRGAMATVYRAHDEAGDRTRAVKILDATYAVEAVVRERFRREATTIQRLAHPNIVEVEGQGDTDDGVPFLVMELLHGETLAALVERGPIPLARGVRLMIQMARALGHAHGLDVVTKSTRIWPTAR